MSIRLLLLAALFAAPLAAQTPAAKPAPPATLRSILLAQLRSTHNKAEWFVPINTAVAGLTPEQARWIPHSEGAHNPAPADHSIGMLANHILFWNTQALARMKDPHAPRTTAPTTRPSTNGTPPPGPQPSQSSIRSSPNSKHFVGNRRRCQPAAKWASQIAHIGTHNAYHTGQIIEIRKLQGSWDPEKGVK